MSIDFDSDTSIEAGITPAGKEARDAGGNWQVAFEDGTFLAWVQHPLAGVTGKERAGALEEIRAQWNGRVASREAKALASRRARRAALDLEADRAQRDNVNAPIPNSGGIILPDSVRSAVAADTTPAVARGPADVPQTPAQDTDPLAYAKAQLMRAMKSYEAASEKQTEIAIELANIEKAISKWTKMINALGDDE